MYLYGALQQVPAAILAAQLQCCHVADSSYQHCKATKKLQALDQCMCLHCSMTAAARGKVWGLDTITSQQSWKFQRVSLRFYLAQVQCAQPLQVTASRPGAKRISW